MEFSSKLIENAVNEISNLPGIGKKTALRLVLHLLKQSETQSINLSNAISEMRLKVNFCDNCHNISDNDNCEICSNPRRDSSLICVVEDIRDVMAIEKTSSFNGLYHVLGGKISPLDGIGPDDLNIRKLMDRVKPGMEVVIATNPTVEGETTALFLSNTFKEMDIKVTRIARGIPVGGDLEYTDEATIIRALEGRALF